MSDTATDEGYDAPHLRRRAANYTPLSPLSFLARAAAIYPDKTAIIHGTQRTSYAEFYARSRRLADALRRRGVGVGDAVAIMAPNIPAMLEAHYGVAMAGGVLNALNYRLDARSIAFILDHGGAKVVLTDREFSPVMGEALALARLNHQLVGAPRTVHFVRGDLATAVAPGSLDAMISNPPYLTLSEYARLDPSVRDWEPALALTAGADGMEQTTRLVREGWAWVRPGGWMALELDCSRANAAATLAAGNGWQNVSLHRDLFGRERYLLAQRSDTR